MKNIIYITSKNKLILYNISLYILLIGIFCIISIIILPNFLLISMIILIPYLSITFSIYFNLVLLILRMKFQYSLIFEGKDGNKFLFESNCIYVCINKFAHTFKVKIQYNFFDNLEFTNIDYVMSYFKFILIFKKSPKKVTYIELLAYLYQNNPDALIINNTDLKLTIIKINRKNKILSIK